MQVKLGHLVARFVSGICHIYGYDYVVIAAGCGRRYCQIVKGEGCVAEPIAEREERLTASVHIFAGLGWVGVIEDWYLSDATGKRDGKFAAWVVVAEERLSNGL